MYCSRSCWDNSRRVEVVCAQCGKPNIIYSSELAKNGRRNFCDRRCAATYNNLHKTHGTRRSKLERFIEVKLLTDFPDLPMKFNDKDAIGSELDIYVPSLKFAVELNGIYHYQPVHGSERLHAIMRNDALKHMNCRGLGIELMVLDTSSLLRYSEGKALTYYTHIQGILLLKLAGSVGKG